MDDPFNHPILVSDLVKMFIKPIGANTRPYVAAVSEEINKYVSQMKKELLDELASSDGTISAGNAARVIRVYIDGIYMRKFDELYKQGLIKDAPPEIIEEWKTFFEKSTSAVLAKAGTTAVSYGWSIIKNHFKILNATNRNEKFFNVYTDPLERESNVNKHRHDLESDIYDFWSHDEYNKIREKVASVLLYNPNFDNVEKKDEITPKEIHDALFVTERRLKNMKPYEQISAKRNNKLVDDFTAFMEKNVTWKVSSDMAFKVWGVYCDGIEVNRYNKFLNDTTAPTVYFDEVLCGKWIDILCGDVTHLVPMGPATVDYGHGIFRNFLQDKIVRGKFDFYSQNEDEWLNLTDDFDKLPDPFTDDDIRDVNEKAFTVIHNIVEPNK